MEDTIRRIQLLQEQRELRRKYYEEEERRIQEEYQRELVKIEEEFEKAAKEIEVEFAAKRNEVKNHFGDDSLGDSKAAKGSKPEPQSAIDAGISPSVCTTPPIKAINHQLQKQSLRQRNNHLFEQWLNAGNVACGIAIGGVSRGEIMRAGLRRHSSARVECKVEYNINCIKEIACNLGYNFNGIRCNRCNGLKRCEERSTMMTTKSITFIIYDPGGKKCE